MDYLRRHEIIRINQRTVEAHGGNYVPPENLLNGSALDYLVESVQAEMFGQPLYPTIADKAGVYMYNVISNHVFQDGNKRTGLEAASVFLRLNGYRFVADLQAVEIDGVRYPENTGSSHNEHLINFTLAVAAGQVPLNACRQWFAANTVGRLAA